MVTFVFLGYAQTRKPITSDISIVEIDDDGN